MVKDIMVRFRLSGDEAEALEKLADVEFRLPREQVRFLLRQELVRRGFLNAEAVSRVEAAEFSVDMREVTDEHC